MPDYLSFLAAIAVRTAIVLLLVSAAVRLVGKRRIGGLHVYDLMLILLVANAVQNAMTTSNGALWVALISAGTILTLGWLVARVFIVLPRLELRLVGTPTVLVQRGRCVPANLKREHVEEREILMAAREQGIAGLDAILIAVLEPDGTISIVPDENAGIQE